MKNTKYISSTSLINTETGVEISQPSIPISIPEKIRIRSHFIKVHERAVQSLDPKDLAKLCFLRPYLEWETNRLVNKHVGRFPIPLKQKDVALILNVSERTVSSFFTLLQDAHGIFRFDSQYYINPSFIGASDKYDINIIMQMMDEDPYLKEEIDDKNLKKIKQLIRVNNMNW